MKLKVSLLAGSWWTWTIISSSITPTKTPSSSTLRATQTPTRLRWQRSDSSLADLNFHRYKRKETLCLLVGWNLQGCYHLADKLTDSIATVHWWRRSDAPRSTSPSLFDTLTLWSRPYFLCRRTMTQIRRGHYWVSYELVIYVSSSCSSPMFWG